MPTRVEGVWLQSASELELKQFFVAVSATCELVGEAAEELRVVVDFTHGHGGHVKAYDVADLASLAAYREGRFDNLRTVTLPHDHPVMGMPTMFTIEVILQAEEGGEGAA